MSTRLETLKIADLVRDDRLRFRDNMHAASGVVDVYREAMIDYGGWGEFEPIVVCELTAIRQGKIETQARCGKTGADPAVYVPGTLLLVGGYTRCEAADAAGVLAAPAVVHSGDWEYALQLAWHQNSRHGRPRSTDELRQVLTSIHQQARWAEAGERVVAELAGCSRATVNRFRAELKKIKELAEKQPEPQPIRRDSKGAFAPALRDKWQRPVPLSLRAAFEVNADLDSRTKSIRNNVIDLARLKHGVEGKAKCLNPGLIELNLERVAKLLLEAADLIDCQRPFVICPHCDAAGCSHCHDRGWLTRPQAEQLPAALEKKAQSYSTTTPRASPASAKPGGAV
jgi:hypothetical protein